jgi:hypothetical protein
MKVGKYVNKERVTAICWTGNEVDLPEAIAFASKGVGVEGVRLSMTGESLVILTEPRIVLPPGHWLVMSSSGRLSSRDPSVFSETYEEAL